METTDQNVNATAETVEKIKAGAHEAVDKVANATTQAAYALGEKGEQLKNAEQQMMENCRNYVHANPIQALGIAVGAGFILSRLLNNR
jgi:ElaB/YqjD/DUF883 family membrane-anchored ribosome-binding protein